MCGQCRHHLYWLLLLVFILLDWLASDMYNSMSSWMLITEVWSTNCTIARRYEWVIVRMCVGLGGVNQTLLIVCWSVCLQLIVRPFNSNFSTSFQVDCGQLRTDSFSKFRNNENHINHRSVDSIVSNVTRHLVKQKIGIKYVSSIQNEWKFRRINYLICVRK